MSNVTYTIEGLADGTWCREHVGANESNLFASREEAEGEIPNLAGVLECDVSDLRVVEFAGITVELDTPNGPRVEYGRGDDEAAVEAALPARARSVQPDLPTAALSALARWDTAFARAAARGIAEVVS